jgi:hypothetical protein
MAETSRVNLSGFQTKMRNMQKAIADEGATIALQAAKIGETEMKRIIDTSTTRTGDERVASGRGASAGRRESNRMYNSVKSSGSQGQAKWGWLSGYLSYFGEQEYGKGKIQAMHSLRDSRQVVLDELPRLVRNAKARIRYAGKLSPQALASYKAKRGI